MVSKLQHFCADKSQTGLVVVFQQDTTKMWVGLPCHPESRGIRRPPNTVVCGKLDCANSITSPEIEDAMSMWGTGGTVSKEHTGQKELINWVSGWTGIPKEDLTVEVEWR